MKLILIVGLTLLIVAVSVDGLRIIRPPRKCPPLCKNRCLYGRVLDSRGCPTCTCKPKKPGNCSILCRSVCLFGQRSNSRCRACKCRRPTTCSKLLCALCRSPYGRRNRRCRTCRC